MLHRATTLWHNHVYKRLSGFSFIQWHYFYFIVTSLISSLIFWGSSTPAKSVTYIDSIFLCVSAMTEAGLNTVNLSELNTWQQIMMFLLIILGSAIFVSSSVLHIRKVAFETKFAELIEKRRRRLHRPRALSFSLSRKDHAHSNDRDAAAPTGALRGRQLETGRKYGERKESLNLAEQQQPSEPRQDQELAAPHLADASDNEPNTGHIRFVDSMSPLGHKQPRSQSFHRSPSFFEGRGVGARRLENHPRNARPMDIYEELSEDAIEDESPQRGKRASKVHKYIDTIEGYLGRNSQFHHLSEKERRKLGGIEYDAISLLSWLVPAYFVLFQLFGALGVGAWLTANHPDMTRRNG